MPSVWLGSNIYTTFKVFGNPQPGFTDVGYSWLSGKLGGEEEDERSRGKKWSKKEEEGGNIQRKIYILMFHFKLILSQKVTQG